MKFVVVAAKRTGSSHFVNMLSAHPDVFCHGNVYKSGTMPVLWPGDAKLAPDAEKKFKNDLSALRDSDPRAFLASIFAMNHGKDACGFKIFWNQNNEILDELLDDPSVRKVILFRRNVLANFASSKSAASNNTWNVNVDQNRAGWEKVRFTEKNFLKFYDSYIGFYRRIFEHLYAHRQPYHLITYDEINDPTLIAGVINFVGGDPTKPIALDNQPRKQVKQGPSDILSRFANPDDVREFLVRKNMQHWTHEGETGLQYLTDEEHDDSSEED